MIEIQYLDVPELNLDYVHDWYEQVVQKEGKILGDLSIVFGTDEWLLEQNKTFLNHDYYTDIITFDYCEMNFISGDLLISIDRVYDNAVQYNVSRETELNRVLVHGLLHLCGYGDKSEKEIEIMRKKEDYYLSLL